MLLFFVFQATFWVDTTNEDPSIIADARSGGSPHTYTNIDPKMMADIRTVVSRLVAKASQLIGNFTTNLAECWMHIRTKFDSGKFINRSQSGSFNIVAWVPASVSMLVECGDQSPGKA